MSQHYAALCSLTTTCSSSSQKRPSKRIAHSRIVASGLMRQYGTRASEWSSVCTYLVAQFSIRCLMPSVHAFVFTVGKVNLCSPDHVSLLVHRTFNVSIPRHSIPTDHWEFEYGPAENDPEFGAAAAGKDNATEEGAQVAEQAEDSGRWVHKITGMPLGDAKGFLKFTVIGCVSL